MDETIMNDIYLVLSLVIPVQVIALIFLVIAKKWYSNSRFKRFLGILGIGMISSLIPLGFIGFFMGFPAVLMAAILTAVLIDRE